MSINEVDDVTSWVPTILERSGDQGSCFVDRLPSIRFIQRGDGKIRMVFNFSGFFGADFDCRARPGRFKDSVRHT